MRKTVCAALLILASLASASCRQRESAFDSSAPRPVLVQGAMDVEVRTLVAAIDHPREEQIDGWTFWSGTLDGYPVVISKTLKGMANAAAATAIGAARYHPAAIINQGTAGGHDPELHVLDIVLGAQVVNIGAFKTGARRRGEGSNFSDWQPMDLLYSEGSAGTDPRALTMRRFAGDEGLLMAAKRVRQTYARGRVAEGVIGSSEIWNSELDRIGRLHDEFGTAAEEMEAASAAQIAARFEVPFLGIRVLSNNITNGGAYDPTAGVAGQEFVYQVVKAYVAGKPRR
jgi:adenosylhomocysteine nucleosidase